MALGGSTAFILGVLVAGGALFGVLATGPGPGPASATLYVDDDGLCGGMNVTCYLSVSDALAAAADGDVIRVFDGRYGPVVVDKSVRVENMYEAPAPPVVFDGARREGIRVVASNVVLKNLTVSNSTDGVLLQGPSVVLENLRIDGGTGVGVRALDIQGVTLDGTTIIGNAQGGVVFDGVRAGRIVGGDISGNGGRGVFLDGGGQILIAGNIISKNVDWAIEAHGTVDLLVQGNDISGTMSPVPIKGGRPQPAYHSSGGGIKFWEVDPTAVEGNVIAGNQGTGVYLLDSVDITVRENDVSGNDLGIELAGAATSSVFWNNFERNLAAVVSNNSTSSFFDDGNGHGNFWDDYTGQDDGSGVGRAGEPRVAGDGIGDTDVPHEGVDWYPYMMRDGWRTVGALIDLKPETLNAKSGGRFVTVFVQLEDGSDPSLIRLDTVVLETTLGSVPAEASPSSTGDHNGDGVPDRMMKFDRQALIAILGGGGDITINVSGELEDGRAFFGTVTVRVTHAP